MLTCFDTGLITLGLDGPRYFYQPPVRLRLVLVREIEPLAPELWVPVPDFIVVPVEDFKKVV